MMFLRYKLNCTGDRGHPWHTPTDVRNYCTISPSCSTAFLDGPYSDSSSVTSPSCNTALVDGPYSDSSSVTSPSCNTALVDGPYSDSSSVTSPSSMLYHRITCQSPLCYKQSNAFLKSMKL